MIKLVLKKPYLTLLIFIVVFNISCSKDETVKEVGETGEETPVEDKWGVNKTNQFALNVIFYKPSDYVLTDRVSDNVSTMMLYIQKWYAKQMELNGYGQKTFGLITNQNNKIRVHVIEGKHPSSYYYDMETAKMYSTLSVVKDDVNQFFSTNPSLKKSDHYMIFAPEETLMRFVGSGKYSFARGTNFEMADSGKSVDGFELRTTNQLGGILHELGHGLNLPHNCHKSSDFPNVALMSFGNQTYQSNPERVFLTKASADILSVNQVFNSIDEIYYNETIDAIVKEFNVTKNESTGKLTISGTIESEIELSSFGIGQDGFPFGGATGYDMVTWGGLLSSSNDTYSFNIEIDYSDIFNGYKDSEKDQMMFTFYVNSKSGSKKTLISYEYNIDLSTQIPNDNVDYSFSEFILSDRSNWSIATNTASPNPDRVASKIIDTDLASYWRSKYPYNLAIDGAHQIDINMVAAQSFKGVYIYSDKNNSNYFRPKHIIIKVSADGLTYTTLKKFSIDSPLIDLRLEFDEEVSATFLRLLIDEVYNGVTEDQSLLFNEIDIIK